jgi:hypothetical protein
MVGNEPAVREMYDTGRAWDGLSALVEHLARIPSDLSQLRAAAELRYFGHQVVLGRAVVVQTLDAARLALRACDGELERVRLVGEQTDHAFEEQAALLDTKVNEDLLIAGRRGATTLAEVRKVLDPRVSAAASRATDALMADLDAIRATIDDLSEGRADRPSTRLLSEYLGDDKTPDERSLAGTFQRGLDRGAKFGPALSKAISEYHERSLGMTVAEAAKELKRVSKAGSLKRHLEETGKKALLKTPDRVAAARRAVNVHSIGALALPAVIELGSLALKAAERRERRQQAAKLREERRTELAESAREFVTGIEKAWAPLASDIRAWVTDNERVYDTRRGVLTEDVRRLEEADRVLADLLDRWPGG